MVLETIHFLNGCGIFGIKLQLLHILDNTDLAGEYRAGKVQVLTLDSYLTLLITCIAALSPDIVIHRVTGDGPKSLLIAPDWSRNKRNVLNTLHQRMKLSSIRQGQCYESGTFDSLQINCTVHAGQGHISPDHSTNFLTLQTAISELMETGLAESRTILNRTQLQITDEGRDTLHYFENRISDAIKSDIIDYFKNHKLELRNESSIQGNFYKLVNGEFEAQLVAKDKDVDLVNIRISVPTQELAASICANWQKKNKEIYQYLTEQLF